MPDNEFLFYSLFHIFIGLANQHPMYRANDESSSRRRQYDPHQTMTSITKKQNQSVGADVAVAKQEKKKGIDKSQHVIT